MIEKRIACPMCGEEAHYTWDGDERFYPHCKLCQESLARFFARSKRRRR